MSEWKEYKLNSFCKVGSSKRIFSSEYVPFGIPFFRSKEIIEKSFGDSINELLFISEEKFREIDTKYGSPKEGDILISSVGARSGIPYLVKKEDGEFYFKDGNLIWIKDFSENLDSNFLLYWFKSNIGQDSFQSITIGSAQPALTIDGISNLFIKLPDVKTQKQIADILSCLDAKIENLRRQNETLEQIAQTLFKHWFIDFEFPNAVGKPYKSSGGAMFASELGNIPEGWKAGKLASIIDVRDGTHDSPKQANTGFHLITSKHLKKGGIDFNSAYLISKDDYVDINKRSKVDTYDILLSMIGTVGLLYLVFDEDIKFAIKNIGLFKTSKNIEYAEFIYLLLDSDYGKSYFRSRLAGTTQSYITLGSLREMLVILPNSKIIKEFKILVQPVFKKYHLNNQQIQTLTKTRDSLLPKLMSGQLRVKE